MIKFVECPRDAMQGIHKLIPTEKKIEYIQSLLNVGFDIIDFGSFVSPRLIPQMADTHEVVKALDISRSKSELLAIVVNARGAIDASSYDIITHMGFPFSISETFQKRNANSSIAESFERVKEIQSIAQASGKKLTVYISMGFGNPYGDFFDEKLIGEWVAKIAEIIGSVFQELNTSYPHLEFGAHLHSASYNWLPKVRAAYKSGCKRFDVAIGGLGGCPMSGDMLVGNLATEYFVNFFRDQFQPDFNINAFEESLRIAKEIF
jgi:hydroxymethylglutaryl-CoA lyase